MVIKAKNESLYTLHAEELVVCGTKFANGRINQEQVLDNLDEV